MATGIGTDIVKIARFERGFSDRFLTRVFSEYERAYVQKKNAASIAGLFAAKEAVVKALGSGFSGFWPCDIEILHDVRGKPYVRLRGKAARLLKRRHKIMVSISHNETDAIAFAVVQRIN